MKEANGTQLGLHGQETLKTGDARQVDSWVRGWEFSVPWGQTSHLENGKAQVVVDIHGTWGSSDG